MKIALFILLPALIIGLLLYAVWFAQEYARFINKRQMSYDAMCENRNAWVDNAEKPYTNAELFNDFLREITGLRGITWFWETPSHIKKMPHFAIITYRRSHFDYAVQRLKMIYPGYVFIHAYDVLQIDGKTFRCFGFYSEPPQKSAEIETALLSRGANKVNVESMVTGVNTGH